MYFYRKYNLTYTNYIMLSTPSEDIVIDYQIAENIGLTLEEYQRILSNFNGENFHELKLEWGVSAFIFNNEQDCQNAVDYLNENLNSFLIIKNLIK